MNLYVCILFINQLFKLLSTGYLFPLCVKIDSYLSSEPIMINLSEVKFISPLTSWRASARELIGYPPIVSSKHFCHSVVSGRRREQDQSFHVSRNMNTQKSNTNFEWCLLLLLKDGTVGAAIIYIFFLLWDYKYSYYAIYRIVVYFLSEKLFYITVWGVLVGLQQN